MNFQHQRKSESDHAGAVLVLSHVFPNPCNPVAGTYVLDQVKALRELGVKVFVVSPSPWPPPLLGFLPRVGKFHAVPNRSEVAGCLIEYPRVLTFPGQTVYMEGLLYYLRCRSLVRKLVRENGVTLIHAHMILPDGLAAVLLGKELKVPVVCTLHGSDIRIYPHRDRITRWLTKWALRNADHLLAVSSELKNKALSLSPRAKISVVCNGADPSAFMPMSKAESRARLGLLPGKKIVLFVGNIKQVKGIEFLLQAISQLRRDDLQLCLVGEGESRPALISMAHRLGIAEQCKFAGRQPHDEIAFWLTAADCVVLPSLSEGLPTILVEAMFCGTPVVATDVGGVPEIVQNRRTGLLVKPQDSESLAQAIAEILADPDLSSELVQLARAQVQGRLTWDANARATIAAYDNVLHQNSTAGASATSSVRWTAD